MDNRPSQAIVYPCLTQPIIIKQSQLKMHRHCLYSSCFKLLHGVFFCKVINIRKHTFDWCFALICLINFSLEGSSVAHALHLYTIAMKSVKHWSSLADITQ